MESTSQDAEKSQAETTVDAVVDRMDISRVATGLTEAHDLERSPKKPSTSQGDFLKPISRVPLIWSGALVTVTLFCMTVVYAITADLGSGAAWLQSSQSRALLLRVLSEATGVFLTLLISSSLERLQWMLVSRRGGLSLPTLFSLEAGTGVIGMMQLMFSRGFTIWTRLSSFTRLLLKFLVPVLAVVIMSKVPYVANEAQSAKQTTGEVTTERHLKPVMTFL